VMGTLPTVSASRSGLHERFPSFLAAHLREKYCNSNTTSAPSSPATVGVTNAVVHPTLASVTGRQQQQQFVSQPSLLFPPSLAATVGISKAIVHPGLALTAVHLPPSDDHLSLSSSSSFTPPYDCSVAQQLLHSAASPISDGGARDFVNDSASLRGLNSRGRAAAAVGRHSSSSSNSEATSAQRYGQPAVRLPSTPLDGQPAVRPPSTQVYGRPVVRPTLPKDFSMIDAYPVTLNVSDKRGQSHVTATHNVPQDHPDHDELLWASDVGVEPIEAGVLVPDQHVNSSQHTVPPFQ
jgi:hypothetical protein